MNYLGISKEKVSPVVHELNILLADYHVYYQNLRNCHWNVDGENFFALHENFEKLYEDARLKIDEIAERILTLRFRPASNMSEYLGMSSVDEAGEPASDRDMVNILLDNHKLLIEQMRQVLNVAETAEDEGTTDMISNFLSNLEKKSWMLDAWLAKKRKLASAS